MLILAASSLFSVTYLCLETLREYNTSCLFTGFAIFHKVQLKVNILQLGTVSTLFAVIRGVVRLRAFLRVGNVASDRLKLINSELWSMSWRD